MNNHHINPVKQIVAMLALIVAVAIAAAVCAAFLHSNSVQNFQVIQSITGAEVEKIKAVTDAERQKELAEIEAKKAVSVAELAKQQAAIEANKKLEVAEIQRKEEEQKLEIIRIQAEQKVAEAQAKQKEIELSGAITEQERVKLEIEKETKIGVAAAWAAGIAQMKLPETLMLGNGGGKEGSAVTDLINLMTIEKAKEVSGK